MIIKTIQTMITSTTDMFIQRTCTSNYIRETETRNKLSTIEFCISIFSQLGFTGSCVGTVTYWVFGSLCDDVIGILIITEVFLGTISESLE